MAWNPVLGTPSTQVVSRLNGHSCRTAVPAVFDDPPGQRPDGPKFFSQPTTPAVSILTPTPIVLESATRRR